MNALKKIFDSPVAKAAAGTVIGILIYDGARGAFNGIKKGFRDRKENKEENSKSDNKEEKKGKAA